MEKVSSLSTQVQTVTGTTSSSNPSAHTHALSKRTALWLMGIGYFSLGLLSVVLSRLEGNLAVLWLANAFAVFVLLCRPKEDAKLLLGIQIIANTAIQFVYGDNVLLTLAFDACNAIEVALSAYLLSKYFSLEKVLRSPAEFLKALLIGGVLAAAVGATLGSGVLSVAGFAPFDKVWAGWFLGGLFGYLTFAAFTPIFIYEKQIKNRLIFHWQEIVLLLGATVACYEILTLINKPYISAQAILLAVLVFRTPLAASLSNIFVGLMLTVYMGQAWEASRAHGLTMNLWDELVPNLALLFVNSLMIAYVKAQKLAKNDADIHAQEIQVQSQLKQQKTEELIGALDAAQLGQFSLNLKSRIVTWDARCWEIYGEQRSADNLTQTFDEFISKVHPDDRQKILNPFGTKSASLNQTFEIRLINTSGKVSNVKVFRKLMVGADGIATGATGFIQDVTAEHEQMRELQAARAQAEAADRAKTRFLNNMSHEMRTPLNGIMGYAEILKSSGLNPVQLSHLNKLQSASTHLLSVINDVLDYGKLKDGEFTLHNSPIWIGPLLNQVKEIIGPMASKKGLDFNVSATDIVTMVSWLGDEQRLKQILLNMLSNAVKFTNTGSVSLSARRHKSGLTFTVQDTGIGIKAEDQAKLFNRFTQVDDSSTRIAQGTGLGLAISKELAQRMNGDLTFTSEYGVGTTFTLYVELPIINQPEQPSEWSSPTPLPAQAHDEMKLSGISVLIVDDSDMNLDVCSSLLEKNGAKTKCASNGLEAVNWMNEHGKSVDVIIIDVHMDVMDGLEATRKIRENPAFARVPIIGLTAGASVADKQAVFDAGMDGYLLKPFDVVELLEFVRSQAIAYRGDIQPKREHQKEQSRDNA